jgi:hypothetical protein
MCPGFAAEMMFSQIKTLGRTTRRLNLYLNGTGIIGAMNSLMVAN